MPSTNIVLDAHFVIVQFRVDFASRRYFDVKTSHTICYLMRRTHIVTTTQRSHCACCRIKKFCNDTKDPLVPSVWGKLDDRDNHYKDGKKGCTIL